MRFLCLILLLSTYAVAPVYGETVADATKNYFDVMKSGNYAAAAALFDPAELKSFRDSLSFISELPDASRKQIYSGLFGLGATQKSVDTLSDSQFFAVFFAAAMSQANISEVMKSAKPEYLGHVMEGENIAHAVTKISVQTSNGTVENLSLATFVRRGESWKMKMNDDVRGVAKRIQTVIGE